MCINEGRNIKYWGWFCKWNTQCKQLKMSLGNFISSEHVIWFSILRWKQNEFGEGELQWKKRLYTVVYVWRNTNRGHHIVYVYNNNALKCQNCFYQKRIQIRLFSFFFIRLSRLCYLQNTWITTNVRCNHFGHMYYIKLCLLRIFHWTKKKHFFETCARARLRYTKRWKVNGRKATEL